MKNLKGLVVGLILGTGLAAWAVNPVSFDIVNLTTGLRIGGAATSGAYLRGNGTNFISGAVDLDDMASGSAASAQLLAILTDETGTGVSVFNNAPTLSGKITRNVVLVDDDDCTGEQGKGWYDTTDSAFEFCNANSGVPVAVGAGATLPVVDTTSVVEGSSDSGKEIRFELDGFASPVVRVLTPQDADYTLAGTTVALGGTGLTSGTSGGILGFTASGTLASSAALGNNSIVLGGGAGAVPTSSTNFTFDDSAFRIRGQNLTTADDNTTNMFQLSGTLPTTPSAAVFGVDASVTSAGSASQTQTAARFTLASGYTGSSETRGLSVNNAAAGTGATLNLGTATGPVLNAGARFSASASGAGYLAGAVMDPSGAGTGVNIGGYAKSAVAAAGSNIGLLASAGNSTEATDLVNVPLYATLGTSLIAGSNISAVAILDNGAAAASMLRIYDNATLMFDFANDGTFTAARTTNLGWAPAASANQACNTTCTAACVFGVDSASSTILACTDATADSCLCAG